MSPAFPPSPPDDADQAVCVVVLRRDAVLLHRRRDVPIWDLPGGAVERGEDPAATAAREVEEETGYQVHIEGPVGRYWRPQDPGGGTLIHVFRAAVTGGVPLAHGPETLAVEWFAPDRLPRLLFPPSREYVRQALAPMERETVPVERTQIMPRWLALALRLAFRLRR